jgi:hypothetical protein
MSSFKLHSLLALEFEVMWWTSVVDQDAADINLSLNNYFRQITLLLILISFFLQLEGPSKSIPNETLMVSTGNCNCKASYLGH